MWTVLFLLCLCSPATNETSNGIWMLCETTTTLERATTTTTLKYLSSLLLSHSSLFTASEPLPWRAGNPQKLSTPTQGPQLPPSPGILLVSYRSGLSAGFTTGSLPWGLGGIAPCKLPQHRREHPLFQGAACPSLHRAPSGTQHLPLVCACTPDSFLQQQPQGPAAVLCLWGCSLFIETCSDAFPSCSREKGRFSPCTGFVHSQSSLHPPWALSSGSSWTEPPSSAAILRFPQKPRYKTISSATLALHSPHRAPYKQAAQIYALPCQ